MVQSSSNTPRLPPFENLRPKQKEIVEAFKTQTFVAAKLPTGYGKTKAAAAAFALLCHEGKCNRLLAVVPRRSQADGIAEELPDQLKQFGISTKAIIVGVDRARSLRYHSDGSVTVFIVTIQSLLSSKTWETVAALLQVGKWFGLVDEHHHYGSNGNDDDGGWTDRIKQLNFAAMLAASATANRHDGRDHFPDATIVETYKHAADQGFIKKLSLHAYHYTVDAVTVDGDVIRLTTEELAEQAGSESPDAIDAFMASRKMRFSPKYVSPLVMFPLDRIIDLRSQGIRAQMLVQAMSCSHAKCVADQIAAQLPANINVDWVGTGPHGKSQEANDEILKRFCPPKNKLTGERPWTLEILINVGMAGEGLDTIDVTEIVFLTPANNTIANKQTIGRGSRRMHRGTEQLCHINVDTSSPMAKHIGRDIELIFDEEIKVPEDDERPREPNEASEYKELPEKLGWLIADMRLTEIRSEPMYKAVFSAVRSQTSQARSDEEVAGLVERGIFDYLGRSSNATAIHAQKEDQIEAAVSKIAGLVIRRMMDTGMRVERTLAGDLKKRINRQKRIAFGAVADADESALDRHWEWLKTLERAILLGHNLEGLPQWLR